MRVARIKGEKIRVHCLLDGVGFGGSGKRLLANAITLAEIGVEFNVYAPKETIARLILQFGAERCSRINFQSIGVYSDGQLTLSSSSIAYLKKNFKAGDVIHLVAPWTIPWQYRKSILFSYVNVYFPFQSKIQYIKDLFSLRLRNEPDTPGIAGPRISASNSKIPLLGNLIIRGAFSVYSDLRTLAIMRACARVDILNPELECYAKSLFGNRRVSLTDGLASHAQYMACCGQNVRRDKVIFLGRLEKQKGIDSFLMALPQLIALAEEKERHIEIDIIGVGTYLPQVNHFISQYAGSYVRLKVTETDKVEETLADAKVFLSLQKYSNYPSQALIEAMACGVIPIVTDTGASHRMLPADYNFLIPESNIIHRLPQAILEILSFTDSEFKSRSESILKHVRSEIDDGSQARYYLSLYRSFSLGNTRDENDNASHSLSI